MSSTVVVKDPDAKLDYTIDWTNWLDAGETLATAEWVVPDGLTEEAGGSSDATSATVWLSGGTVGQVYSVTSRVTTSTGRQDDRSFRVFVEDRYASPGPSSVTVPSFVLPTLSDDQKIKARLNLGLGSLATGDIVDNGDGTVSIMVG